jgi:hypothetical protein
VHAFSEQSNKLFQQHDDEHGVIRPALRAVPAAPSGQHGLADSWSLRPTVSLAQRGRLALRGGLLESVVEASLKSAGAVAMT